MRISREEIFGPVAAVIRGRIRGRSCSRQRQAVRIATTSLKHATHFRRNTEATIVNVKLPTAGVHFHVPVGGRKGSSHGSCEQGRYANEKRQDVLDPALEAQENTRSCLDLSSLLKIIEKEWIKPVDRDIVAERTLAHSYSIKQRLAVAHRIMKALYCFGPALGERSRKCLNSLIDSSGHRHTTYS